MNKAEIEKKITEKRERLACYLAREKEMLCGGVQSYGVGTRNLARYNTDLSTVRKAIKDDLYTENRSHHHDHKTTAPSSGRRGSAGLVRRRYEQIRRQKARPFRRETASTY